MVYEKLVAANFRLKYKDFFHMKKLYIMVHEWLVEFGWYNPMSPRSYEDWPEVLYLQKESQKRGTELWIYWRFTKRLEGAQYWVWKMNIDWHVILLKESQVMHEGIKYDTNWGEVEISIKAEVIADAYENKENKWEKHWLLKQYNDIFRGRIFRVELEKHKIEVYREAYRLQEAIKSYLALKTYLPEPESEAHFYPALGIGESKGIR